MKLIRSSLAGIIWAIVVGYAFSKDNLSIIIFASVFMILDYLVWLRGGNSSIFVDVTKMEKDLRKIQELEIEAKLKKLKKEAKK